MFLVKINTAQKGNTCHSSLEAVFSECLGTSAAPKQMAAGLGKHVAWSERRGRASVDAKAPEGAGACCDYPRLAFQSRNVMKNKSPSVNAGPLNPAARFCFVMATGRGA